MKSLSCCILGSGASGLTAALALAKAGNKVVVVEKKKKPGGHAASATLKNGHSGDPGFGAFMLPAYPNFVKILNLLKVEIENLGPFSQINRARFSLDRSASWNDLNALLKFHNLEEEAKRFDTFKALSFPKVRSATVGEYLESEGFSEKFIHYYYLGFILYGFAGHPARYYLQHPLSEVIRNAIPGSPKALQEAVYRIKGGSEKYIVKFVEYLKNLGVTFLDETKTQIESRTDNEIKLKFAQKLKKQTEFYDRTVFDRLILAIPPDDALEVLGDHATSKEKEILEQFDMTRDQVVLHQDETFMPLDKNDWRYGNMIIPDQSEPLSLDRPFSLTKMTSSNTGTGTGTSTDDDDDNDTGNKIFATYRYSRPIVAKGGCKVLLKHVTLNMKTVELRTQLKTVQGTLNTWFCGSWTRHFTYHEDAVVSGILVANEITKDQIQYPLIERT